MKNSVILLAALLALPWAAHAQTGGVHVGAAGAPNASAVLDVDATNKGFLPPRLTTAQRDAIASPAAGLTIYNTTTNMLNGWNGTRWVAYIADAATASASTFAFTGTTQTYTVPAGVTRLVVDMAGGGGFGLNASAPGLGGRVQANLAVTPGQVLTVLVGGAGTRYVGGYNGGGASGGSNSGGCGGGASDIRQGGAGLANRVLVAGGGGGSGIIADGGCGGGLKACLAPPDIYGSTGGDGASQQGPGAAGIASASLPYGEDGNAGSSNVGGAGTLGSGSGGGGYFGGGSGGGYAGGGGGSSYAGTGTSSVTHTPGYQSGSGYVQLIPAVGIQAPVLDASNFVNLPAGDNLGNHTATQNLDLGGSQLVGAGGSAGISVDVNGRVGLGTMRPGQLLELAGQVAPTILLHSNANQSFLGGQLQFRENDPTYGWNFRHNTGAFEGGSSDDRLILERVNGSTINPVMTWHQGSGDVTVTGVLEIGLETIVQNYTLPAYNYSDYSVSCPAGKRLLSGGGGHRDFNSAQQDITINFSGPTPSNPNGSWTVRMDNNSSSDRAVQVYCTCARVR